MKKRKRSGGALDQDLGDTLCCCEYIDRHGARTHIAACCCDCEDLDEAFDRWIKKEPQSPESLSRVLATVSDRLRVPWIFGAQRVDLTLIPPLVLLPVFLHVAALHYLLGILVLTVTPICVLWYYYLTHRKKGRTLFFLSLALFSLFYMFFLFLTLVVPQGDVSSLQLVAVTAGVSLTVIFLFITKRGPGYVRSHISEAHSTVTYHSPPSEVDSVYLSGARHQEVIANHRSEVELVQNCDRGSNWCAVCKLSRPSRAGHCRICGVCVLRLDHHCVWINSCVGLANHRSFLLTLLFFLLTSLYGIGLALGYVCPRQSVFTALFYCPDVYSQYSDAVIFTCAWYSSLVTGGLLHLLLSQILNISLDVTEREARLARRENKSLSAHSRGFWDNWTRFMSMSEASELSTQKQSPDLV